jgi:predicted TIM-barrel fold metal-dependent hydrolase
VNEHRPSTSKVVEAIAGRKNLGVVAGISYLNFKQSDLQEINEYLKDGLIKGLKLYPGYEPFYPYDNRLKVIYDMAVEFDVPVMFHSGDTYSPTGRIKFSHPIHIDDVAVDNPEMKIVICHLGNPWIKDCMEVVYKNKNVFTDFSGLVLGNFSDKFEKYMKKEIEEMITYAGDPKYLLYGTDWPISNMDSYLKFIKEIDLPDEKKELIMWKNAAELFKIELF